MRTNTREQSNIDVSEVLTMPLVVFNDMFAGVGGSMTFSNSSIEPAIEQIKQATSCQHQVPLSVACLAFTRKALAARTAKACAQAEAAHVSGGRATVLAMHALVAPSDGT